MKIIVVPDSFKGTFSSEEIIQHVKKRFIERGIAAEIIGIPMADGGEGTVRAMVLADPNAIERTTLVSAPLPELGQVQAVFALSGEKAYLEMAAAAGLSLVPLALRNPERTSTFGVGELVLKVLDEGAKDIYIGIGGSGTNDGGIGFAEALGIRFLGKFDGKYELLKGCGGKLGGIEAIDWSGLDPRLQEVSVTVMCDVTNPLTGPRGATEVYGRQKGATEAQLVALEAGMRHYEAVIGRPDITEQSGAGAAGGLGAALKLYAGAELKGGADLLLDLAGFNEHLLSADLVITGEGSVDEQTLNGKVAMSVLNRVKDLSPLTPVVMLAGRKGNGAELLLEAGVKAIYTGLYEGQSKDLRRGYLEALYSAIDNLIEGELAKNS